QLVGFVKRIFAHAAGENMEAIPDGDFFVFDQAMAIIVRIVNKVNHSECLFSAKIRKRTERSQNAGGLARGRTLEQYEGQMLVLVLGGMPED
ncbi:MAG: hypothetical protein IJ653_09750, partial [Bacteroidales bacterium]|nr:hypothetical protein [Bacteroidales bacterium]